MMVVLTIARTSWLSPRLCGVLSREGFSRAVVSRSDWYCTSGSSKTPEEVLTAGRRSKATFPRLVIFDKNGTLVNCNRYWAPWATALTQKLESTTGLNLEDAVFQALDKCHNASARLDWAQQASCEEREVKGHLQELLRKEGFSPHIAKLLVDASWVDRDQVANQFLNENTDLPRIFANLKSKGVKLAVCAPQNRAVTEASLAAVKLLTYLDAVVCCDEIGQQSKLDSHTLQAICKSLKVKPRESALIADTKHDIWTGKQAGLGLVIGVLSGAGSRLDMAPFADKIADNVVEAINLLETEPCWSDADLMGRNKDKTRRRKISLVIFDKDGTMTCFSSLWTSWARNILRQLEDATGLDLHDQVLQELGYYGNDNQRTASMFLVDPSRQHTLLVLRDLLSKEGLASPDTDHLLQKIATYKHRALTDEYSPPIDSPAALFKILQTHGIKVVVHASDSRWVTEHLLESVWADSFVDMLLCADDLDEDMEEDNFAFKVCETLNVDPAETVVLGKTMEEDFAGEPSRQKITVKPLRQRNIDEDMNRCEGLILITERNQDVSLPREENMDVLVPERAETQPAAMISKLDEWGIILREPNKLQTYLIEAKSEQNFITKAKLICTAVLYVLSGGRNQFQDGSKQRKDVE